MSHPFHGARLSCLNNYSTFDFHLIGINYFHMNHIHKQAFICFDTCYYSYFGHSDSSDLITMCSSFDHLNCCSDIYHSGIINHYNMVLVDMRVPAV